MRQRRWAWVYLIAASIHATSLTHMDEPVASYRHQGHRLHPWWLADERCGNAEIDLLCQIAAQERFVGEVGLDFSARFAGSEPLQIQAFDRLCDTLVQCLLPGA